MDKSKRIKKDAKLLKSFIVAYCRVKHGSDGKSLCHDCRALLEYALKRDEKCPLDPKPKCKDCKIHCYKPEMRDKIKDVMKFSGIYYIKRGRIDYLFHYFF
ncbi:MAG: nitrous oxide-stimulated promoter family protein [Calditerrivibrio sp.]|nr:nitrous oxide-stimulated promoter family protein [Calditerrivibrio sp.]MCA1933498.1 nitrous oxide-stimulated promoter family protein [Calditerrivibrio sp.]MCA1981096.1 nitrous oxide-stimulated promoter family protein [Calditerrivibrio sp.]